MIEKRLDIGELKQYINAAFEGDEEVIELYDKNVKVETIEDVCANVFSKIKIVEDVDLFGVEIENEAIGYFVCEETNLVSFGVNKKYRNKEYLSEFWELIKAKFADEFTCVLWAQNKRAIKWLEKSGMNILFENITILKLCQQS